LDEYCQVGGSCQPNACSNPYTCGYPGPGGCGGSSDPECFCWRTPLEGNLCGTIVGGPSTFSCVLCSNSADCDQHFGTVNAYICAVNPRDCPLCGDSTNGTVCIPKCAPSG
jgi:hypothetical protein